MKATPWLLVWTVLASCGGEPSPAKNTAQRGPIASVAQAGPVVAEVNGSPITAQALQLSTSSNTKEALSNAIDDELLWQEALRRKLDQTSAAKRALRRALARKVLTDEIITKHKASTIPQRFVDDAYAKNKEIYDAQPERLVHHILVKFERKKLSKRNKHLFVAADKVAQKLHAKLKAEYNLTYDRFRRIGDEIYRDHAKALGLRMTSEKFRMPRHGAFVEPFAKAAFAIKKKGDISPVVDTRFGFHVIYLLETIPGMSVPKEEAMKSVRKRIEPEMRAYQTQRLRDRLAEAHHAQSLSDEALRRVLSKARHPAARPN